jgi:hypothetical protein
MKRNVDLRAIVMSLFGLVAIIAIMMQLQRSLPKPPDVLERLPQEERIGIVDSTYINLPFSFIWTMPTSHWRLKTLSKDTLLLSLTSDREIISRITWLVSARRLQETDAIAACKIGAFSNPAQIPTQDVAINLLAEMLNVYERDGVRVSILQSVKSPAHQTLNGSYFVILRPEKNASVHVVALLPRANDIYVILSETSEDAYLQLRDEIQLMVERFRPLPQWQKK